MNLTFLSMFSFTNTALLTNTGSMSILCLFKERSSRVVIFGGSTIFFSLNFSNRGFLLNYFIKLKHTWYFTRDSKTFVYSRDWFKNSPVFIYGDLALSQFKWICINPLLTSWQYLKLFQGMTILWQLLVIHIIGTLEILAWTRTYLQI